MYSIGKEYSKELFIHTPAPVFSTYALLVFKFVAGYAIGIIMKSEPEDPEGQGWPVTTPPLFLGLIAGKSIWSRTIDAQRENSLH